MNLLRSPEWEEFGRRFTDIYVSHIEQIGILRQQFIEKLTQLFKTDLGGNNSTVVGSHIFRINELELIGQTISARMSCPLVNLLELKLIKEGSIPDRTSRELDVNELDLKARYPFLITYDHSTNKQEEAVHTVSLFYELEVERDSVCTLELPCRKCQICKDLLSLLILKHTKLKSQRSKCFSDYLVRDDSFQF